MEFKFRVDYAQVEVAVDSYENGEELELANSFDLPIGGEVYDTIEDLIAGINDSMGAFSTDKRDYIYIDGRIDTDALVNNDNYEPTDEEYTRWKRGEETLYNAHLCCAITMVPAGGEHPFSEEEAEACGIPLY